MKNRKKNSEITFYCFTPAVSLATFTIEFSFALYVFYKYRSTQFGKLSIALLLSLGIFQLAEYGICKTPYQDLWVKIAYVSITFLPALALHIISTVVKKHKTLTVLSYFFALLLIAAIPLIPQVELFGQCMSNYVAIQVNWVYGLFYKTYYLGFIFIGMYILLYSLRKKIGDKTEVTWMLISYMVFVVPSLILYYLEIIAKSSLPSVMCGLALITAFIFVFIIIPHYYKRKGIKS